jgi:hypothetical protein
MFTVIVVKGENIEYDDSHRATDEVTMTEDDWADRAKGLLKAELKRRNLTYHELAERLTAAGSPENARNLTNKISRGSFTAAFLLQCLDVIGCRTVHLDGLSTAVEAP